MVAWRGIGRAPLLVYFVEGRSNPAISMHAPIETLRGHRPIGMCPGGHPCPASRRPGPPISPSHVFILRPGHCPGAVEPVAPRCDISLLETQRQWGWA